MEKKSIGFYLTYLSNPVYADPSGKRIGEILKDGKLIPFYVAAPSSTVDISLVSGKEIPIEERAPGR
jgi:hypothetical protein